MSRSSARESPATTRTRDPGGRTGGGLPTGSGAPDGAGTTDTGGGPPVGGSARTASRAQAEAVSSLIAVAVLVTAVSLHAGVLADAVPEADRDVAGPTLSRVHDRLAVSGVVAPATLPNATLPAPDGFRLNVTVTAGGRRWTRGPAPPTGAEAAGRPAPVRLAPARVEPGRLRVEVWR